MVATRSKAAPGPRPRPRADLAAHPSEEELITSFLRPRVVSGDDGDRDRPRPSAPFIHDADVYSAGPGALTGRVAPALASNGDSAWYFFSAVRTKTRDGQHKARTVDTGDGCWHSEAGAKPVVVVEESGAGRIVLVGHRQGFSFVTKVDGRRVRSGWLMVELSLEGAGADDVVLCKMYFSPRARASASASASSGRNRKAAAADDKNPADSARRRRRGPATTEAEAGTPAPNNAEEKDNTQSRGLADDNSTVTDDDPEALWTDDSIFSWWMRNKAWFMEEYNIVDRTDEEIQKTYGLDEYLRLLKHHYTDFGCGHSSVLNS